MMKFQIVALHISTLADADAITMNTRNTSTIVVADTDIITNTTTTGIVVKTKSNLR